MTPVTPKYQFVSTLKGLKQALAMCHGDTSLDFETTALRPSEGRVRLVSLHGEAVSALVDFDGIRGGFRRVAKLFDRPGVRWIVFNSVFEMSWFLDAGVQPAMMDVGLMRKAVLGGGNASLKGLLAADLGLDVSKEEQASDWSAAKLTQSQLDYAYMDAHLTHQLYNHWAGRMDKDHWLAADMLQSMVPAVIEMQDAGLRLNQRQHRKLVADWVAAKDKLEERVRAAVSPDEVPNVQSAPQWSDFLGSVMPQGWLDAWPKTPKTGQLSTKRKDLQMMSAHAPEGSPLRLLLVDLAGFKTMQKYVSSFGDKLIDFAKADGDSRIRATFRIAQAKTGRFSSAKPNIQQVPRDHDLLGVATSVRRSFIAPRGKLLVSLDFSGIELRALALISGDAQLLADTVHGDVHSEVAAVIAGRKIDKKTKGGKEARTAAKAVSFGIIFGSGATGLAGTMGCSVGVAQRYIDFWAERYELAFGYRHLMQDENSATNFIRVIDGGTIYGGPKASLPQLANWPVQRAAGTAMFHSIARHKTTLDAERAAGRQSGTLMLATIHDALIDEADRADAPAALEMMRADMVAGYLDAFGPDAPTENLVEGGIGPNWQALA